MSFVNNVLNQVIFRNSSRVPDYPRSRALAPSFYGNYVAYLAPKFGGVVNYLPAVGVLGLFMIYPALSERFKWRAGFPSTYKPTEEDLAN